MWPLKMKCLYPPCTLRFIAKRSVKNVLSLEVDKKMGNTEVKW